MLQQFQNEIIGTIFLILLIVIYFINNKRHHVQKDKQILEEYKQELLHQSITNEEIEKEKETQTDVVQTDILQDESLLGSQEGEFKVEELQDTNTQLPIQKRAPSQHGKITKQQFSDFSGARVLVAEDNLINQKVITGLFAGSGVEIVLANDGQEALDILKNDTNFFMILMDAHMPRIDGFEATKAIRNNGRYNHIAIVALSGDTAQDDIRKMKEAGMDETLEKPLKIDDLYDTMYIYYNESNHAEFHALSAQNFNADKGLEICGDDQEFFKEILQEFIAHYIDSAQDIETLFMQNRTKELEDALIDIMGVTANIGAEALNETIQNLKYALGNKQKKEFILLMEQYKTHLQLLISQIKEYV